MEADKMTKEKIIEMLEYAETMADKYYKKGDMINRAYWMGKVNAYQNVLAMF